ncbi:hypothetical protein PR202_gb27459 [Eleusine coracana subsp. coracana]|uniref:KIB1-4 beta-propeller domain-containing protein n=1 Tax=Eleusine coracana subsp. coracana TaxID=191504 RepID=A0AAV5FUK2_ELECO|nr:hypothetical protein PR202_gb27459 [Eleusine coracana subsp. coracana]
MRHHLVLGSSGGWIVTADLQGGLHMANPVTSKQAALPHIAVGTIPFSNDSNNFVLDMGAFERIRFGAHHLARSGVFALGTSTHVGWQMRKWFYRKVVLSASPRPDSYYAAMLILDQNFGAPAFATADDPAWRLATTMVGSTR